MSSIDIVGPDGKRLPAGSKAPKGARYRVRYRSPEGASRTKSFDRKIDAEAFAASVEHSKVVGTFVDATAGRMMFGDFAEAWAAAQPHRGTTAQNVRSILQRHILPTFGTRPIASIRTSEVQAWVPGLGLAPSTLRVTYGKLAAIFRAAVDDRVIVVSPCDGRKVRLPRAHGGDVVPMEPEQVRAIAAAMPAHYSALVVLLAGTGLRPAEGLGLCRSRVNWLRRTIRVDQQLVTLSGASPTLGPTKTPSSVRTIPVPDAVIAVLARHVEQYTPRDSELLFVTENGNPIHRSLLGHVWRRAALNAGVDGFTPHDLRHYAASVMIAQGANVKAVQRHLGHASATTTLDTYAHLFPDAEDVTRRVLDAGLVGVIDDAIASRCVIPVLREGESAADVAR
jgi:integrase